MQIVPLPVYRFLFRKTLDVIQVYAKGFPGPVLEDWSPNSFGRAMVWLYSFEFMKYMNMKLSVFS